MPQPLAKMAPRSDRETPVTRTGYAKKHRAKEAWTITTVFGIALQICYVQGLSKEDSRTNTESWPARPFEQRIRIQLEHALLGNHFRSKEEEVNILSNLIKIYHTGVKPLSEAYKYSDINDNLMTEGDITSSSRVLFLGPWSTGKSSILNYLLGIENTSIALPSGATPTTTDFTVLQYGPETHTTDGTILALEGTYAPLRKFGHGFLQKLRAQRIPNKLLQRVTLIDTPGIIENQKQQERGYPFTDVCQWFIQRADMIILVFDPTKLDVGTELEKLFKLLKGSESKVHIVLNKADTVPMQELLRVYSALFWNLSPLINVTEPPRVYLGSFWSKSFSPEAREYQQLFQQEEVALLSKMAQTVRSHMQLRAAALHRQAVQVQNHALLVNQFYETLNQHKSFFRDINEVQDHIVTYPDNYKILQTVLFKYDLSIHDIMPIKKYENFFKVHPIDSFQPLKNHCPFFGSCFLEEIQKAIQNDLPKLIELLELKESESLGQCSRKDGKSDCDEKYKAKLNFSP